MTRITTPGTALRACAAFHGLAAAALLAPAAWAAPFIANSDGTVTDQATGLAWDQCAWGQTGSDCTGGSAVASTWAQALAAAQTANADSHKGHGDWRLPNKNELESLVKIDAASPAIDGTAFPNAPNAGFWSSTTYAPDPAYAWYINFDDGWTHADVKTKDVSVRLVRGGPPLVPFDTLASYTITPSAGPNGTISPGTPQSTPAGGTQVFTLAPADGYAIDQASGCGGSLSGSTYTTAPASADCTVTATFKAATAAPVPVPTLGEWALALLGLLLAGAGFARIEASSPIGRQRL